MDGQKKWYAPQNRRRKERPTTVWIEEITKAMRDRSIDKDAWQNRKINFINNIYQSFLSFFNIYIPFFDLFATFTKLAIKSVASVIFTEKTPTRKSKQTFLKMENNLK